MTNDMNARGIGAKACCFRAYFCSGATHLFDHWHEIALAILDQIEIENGAMGACIDENFGQHGKIARATISPINDPIEALV